ncbi:complement C1q tumor necrosis factor-related protein 2-like, partial [Mizuhopecten yessoensis]
RVAPNGAGAFSVSLSGRDLNLHPNLVIAFDEVLLDMDDHYHAGDGVYTVPVSGVYVFTWLTTGTTTDNVVTELVINGLSQGSIFSDAETGHAWDSTTGVIVTSVSVGDHVFIRSKFSGIIHSSSVYGKAMFSGWRLS